MRAEAYHLVRVIGIFGVKIHCKGFYVIPRLVSRRVTGVPAPSCDYKPWQVYLIDLTWCQGYFSSSSLLEVSF